MINISKMQTTLNRAAWLTASISIVVLVVIVRSYVGSRAEMRFLLQSVASGQKLIDEATKREAARDVALQETLDKIEALKRKVQTPEQVVAALPAAFPKLPLPITVSRIVALNKGQDAGTNHAAPSSRADSPNSASADMNSETSGAVINVPDVDLKPLFDNLEDCREATATAATLRRDLVDTREQLSEMTAERAMAIRKTSRSSRWHNVKQAAKWLAVGAAIGMAFSQKL